MSFVLDPSAFFAWQFPDEDETLVLPVVNRFLETGAVVPVHWIAEVANGYAMAVRRKRMLPQFRQSALQRIAGLPLEVDEQSRTAFMGYIQILCDRHELSAYDASYLELAMRRQLPLATLDKKLMAAARLEGLTLLGGLQ
ncbi:MAG: type II toxin-antitoxin system VapC family toxin [Pseudomonadota bacterium]